LVGAAGAADKPMQFETGDPLPVGQKLNLRTGLAEITFGSGARVILHAPSQFAVIDPLGGNLERGKLTAKVPHHAAGFTVVTPAGKVIDLGTEFGVQVNEDRTMHVVVYVGQVKVESNGGGTDPSSASLKLKAGDGISIAPGQPPRPIVAKDERFIRDMSALDQRASAEAAYVEMVKSLKPAAWYRMEGKDADRVMQDEMGGRDAKLYWSGPGNPFVKGVFGKSLWLRGGKLKDFAVVGKYPQARHDRVSVAAWVYAESLPYGGTIVANWNSDASHKPGGQFCLGLSTKQPGNLAVGFTDGDDNEDWLVEEAAKPKPLPLYQWQHVAFTADGKSLRLYRQGAEVARGKYSGLAYPSASSALSIGARNLDHGNLQHAKDLDWWDGKIDEVTVFNRALSADEIRKLAGGSSK
jgi:hypothetical protein